jgi:hypothetical protein
MKRASGVDRCAGGCEKGETLTNRRGCPIRSDRRAGRSEGDGLVVTLPSVMDYNSAILKESLTCVLFPLHARMGSSTCWKQGT